MDRRLAIGAAVGVAVLAAIALALLVPTPDDPPAPVARVAPPPAVAAVAPAARPSTPPPPPIAPRPPATEGSAEPMPIPRVAPRPPVDAEVVHDAAAGGISRALFTRHDRLMSCYRAHVADHGPLLGRPVIRATVLPDGDQGVLDVRLENGGEGVEALEDCMSGAMTDALFEAPDIPISLLHPLPVPVFGR